MSELFWDVQNIQEISNVEEHSVVKCVTVNTSRLISQLNEELQDEESGVNFIVTQLQLLINNVYEKIQKGPGVPAHRSLMINLNFTRLKFSIAYWDILLEEVTRSNKWTIENGCPLLYYRGYTSRQKSIC